MSVQEFEHYLHYKIVLFDAQCLLCQQWTKFLIKYDRTATFKLVSVQSPLGQRLLETLHFPTDHFDTMVYLDHGKVFTKSTAFLNIIAELGLPWRLAKIAKISPSALRDPLYDLVAKNRYQWFGKTESCLVPNAKLKQHFLESYLNA